MDQEMVRTSTRRIFVSFADTKYEASLRRIVRQARAIAAYDEIWPYSERNLDPAFLHRHRDLLQPTTRGFGYFMWKPHVVFHALEKCCDGDVVHYCDAGCHIRAAGRQRLFDYFNLAVASRSGVLGFKFTPPTPPFRHDGRPLPGFRNIDWCKADLLDHFSLLDDTEFLEDYTFAATTFFVRKSDATMAIIREWRDVMDDNVPLIDDSPSRKPNHPRFIEHRHDQAVFNCLARRYNFDHLSAYEFDYPSLEGEPRPCDIVASYPIHALRDKKRSWRFRLSLRLWRLLQTVIGPVADRTRFAAAPGAQSRLRRPRE
jgi:hypothetical protein